MIWRWYYIDILFAINFLIILGFFVFLTLNQSPKYDCQLAEISPDIPQSVKEECRKAKLNLKEK